MNSIVFNYWWCTLRATCIGCRRQSVCHLWSCLKNCVKPIITYQHWFYCCIHILLQMPPGYAPISWKHDRPITPCLRGTTWHRCQQSKWVWVVMGGLDRLFVAVEMRTHYILYFVCAIESDVQNRSDVRWHLQIWDQDSKFQDQNINLMTKN